MIPFTPKDLWKLTPKELDDLLRIAAWMCESPDRSTADDRHTIADHLRRAAKQVNQQGYDSMAGAAEHYRPGVYNGD